jgi:hypothetical protein
VIGLLMENKAKYMAYIIGLAKIGVTVALINFHLKEEVRNIQYWHLILKLAPLNTKF